MGKVGMDGENSKENKNKYLEDLDRAKEFYKKALSLIEVDLETAANRIYLSFENLARAFLLWKYSQVSKKHAQIWEKTSKLYLQGLLSFDPKPSLIRAYQFHLFVDYGRKELGGEKIDFSKDKLKELLDALKKLLSEIEELLKKKPKT